MSEQTTLPLDTGGAATGVSLRDQLSEAFDTADTAVVTETAVPAATASDAKPAETPKQTADRLRDEKGKFVEGKPAAPASAAAPKADTPSKATAPAAPTAAAADTAKPRTRPSSWKKDHWEAFDKIATENPALADYINERESQYAKGVSTYKQEWESARPLMEAMQTFMPDLQRHNIAPAQWITNLGNAHRTLAMGNAQQKLQTFAMLAQQYGVPVQALTDATAQQQYLQQAPPQQAFQPPQQAALTREEAVRLWQDQYVTMNSEQEVAKFKADQKHEHFDELRDTMAGLLQANLATNLDDAYDAAMRHPRHANLFAAQQQQQRAAEEAERRSAETQRVAQAKARAVSVRSSTPSGAPSGDKATGLRAQLEQGFETHAGGRV